MSDKKNILIIGAGPAGLGAGYFAKQHGLNFKIYEAAPHTGGNSSTWKWKDFYFDSGAHRFHNTDPEITKIVFSLMGNSMHEVNVPSAIFLEGKWIDFPLSPYDLMRKLSLKDLLSAFRDQLNERFFNKRSGDNFEDLALKKYGRTIAQKFLLDYSEKLWGLPCKELSPFVAGKRLKGLDISTFMKEFFLGKKKKTEHLDGKFFYPEKGIGQICEALSSECGVENIFTSSPVQKILHKDFQLTGIVNSKGEYIETDHLINTIPLTKFLFMMEPCPPDEILKIASSLRFRSIRLAVFLLDKHKASSHSSLYFPEPGIRFTRIYEPKNRSRYMAPAGKTSLVAEVPFFQGDEMDKLSNEIFLERVEKDLVSTGLVSSSEITDKMTRIIPDAYPVLTKDIEKKIALLEAYFGKFRNLHMSGRSGKFQYSHIHDQLRSGKDVIDKIMS